MKKRNIVQKTEEFSQIMSEKNFYKNRYYVIYFKKKSTSDYRVGISIPKKIGKAVLRNKLKRQIKSIIDHHLDLVSCSMDYIIIGRLELVNIDYQTKEQRLTELLKKLGQEVN